MSDRPVFGRGAPGFYRGLAKDNSKAYFEAHRETYERAIRVPLEDLLDLAQERFGRGRVMRPHRDVRFSKDKSPYRLTGAMTAGRIGGVYAAVSAEGVWAGGGLYEPSRDQLGRARDALAGPRSTAAPALRNAIETAQTAGLELAGPFLKTAPRGYEKDHPQIELLRLQHYAAMRRLPARATLADIEAVWAAAEPLLAWAERYAGPAQDPRR